MGKRLDRGFYWRGDVIWVRTDPVEHKPKSTRCTDLEAARLWLARRERIAADPVYAASLTATLGHWALKTLEAKKAERSAGTLHFYETKLGHFIRVWGEHLPLATLATDGAEMVDRYIGQRRSEGAVNNTIGHELVALRQLLKRAKRGKAFPGDIAAIMPIGFSRGYKPVSRVLQPADLPALWEALPGDQERAWVAFALAFAGDTVDVEGADKSDYAASRHVMRIHGTKNELRAAELPVVDLLEPLFWFAYKRLPVTWSNASNALGRACRKAGLPHLSPKDLRRTTCTWLARSGFDEHTVSRFMRHKDTTMVRRIYAQLQAEDIGNLLSDRPRVSAFKAELRDAIRAVTGCNDSAHVSSQSTQSHNAQVRDISESDTPLPGVITDLKSSVPLLGHASSTLAGATEPSDCNDSAPNARIPLTLDWWRAQRPALTAATGAP